MTIDLDAIRPLIDGPPTPAYTTTNSGTYLPSPGKGVLRLDVDGHYPQMIASGTIVWGVKSLAHWIASLKIAKGQHHWTGTIWYTDPASAAFPYTAVDIKVTRNVYGPVSAMVTFMPGVRVNGDSSEKTYAFKSPYFHEVDFEFDAVTGEKPTTTYGTWDHANHPATLPKEFLHISQVYGRAGFKVTTSRGGDVPLAGAQADALWSDDELHDAMQVYWSHFASKAQWACWVLFASLHVGKPSPAPDQGVPPEPPENLLGSMFDQIGPHHRQGTSVYTDAISTKVPSDETDANGWIRRLTFYTAVHEIGHTFNLLHSFDKGDGTPWTSFSSDPGALSFMNYPWKYPHGYTIGDGQVQLADFFSEFAYRFSDDELLFLRHAPAAFVQMGNAAWADHHGLEGVALPGRPTFRLEVRANREAAHFEFLEPVTLEVKLTNVSSEPLLIDPGILVKVENFIVLLRKDGKSTRQWLPYVRHCWRATRRMLFQAGESLYGALGVSTGLNGWDIAEPGWYTVQIALAVNREIVVADPLRVRIFPPRNYDEACLAQDLLSDDVGRVLAFGGSRVLTSANLVLLEATTRLASSRIALHAALALGEPLSRDGKELVTDARAGSRSIRVGVRERDSSAAATFLTQALTADPAAAVETFGHIKYREHIDRFSSWLVDEGAPDKATATQALLYETMSRRRVNGRPISPRVLAAIEERQKGCLTQ
jgi:hypothetical protein